MGSQKKYCTKVPHCVEEFIVNSIKFKRIISRLIVFPRDCAINCVNRNNKK